MLVAIVNVFPGANPGQDHLIKLGASALTTEVSDEEISFTGDTYLIYKAWREKKEALRIHITKLTTNITDLQEILIFYIFNF